MTKETPANFIKDYWQLIFCIVSLIVTWTTFSIRLSNAEEKIVKLESVSSSINQINTNIAVMQNDLSYIKKKVQ